MRFCPQMMLMLFALVLGCRVSCAYHRMRSRFQGEPQGSTLCHRLLPSCEVFLSKVVAGLGCVALRVEDPVKLASGRWRIPMIPWHTHAMS